MKTKNTGRRLLVTGALLAFVVPSVRAEEAPPQYEGIQWQEPSPAVTETAKANNKFILADFYADWCGYCKKQDATSYEDDRIILMTDQLVTTKVNEKTHKDLIAQFKITGYPTVVILNTEGQEVARVAGAYEPDGYVQWLGHNLYTNALPNLEASLKKQPDDIKLLAIMALVYGAVNRKDQVPVFLNKAGDATLAKFTADEKITADETGQMARAFRLLSLYFQSHQDYERGVASLHYLAQLSNHPREVVAARLALAESFYQSNRTPKAIAELESLLQLDTLTPEEKQAAQAKLNGYKKAPA